MERKDKIFKFGQYLMLIATIVILCQCDEKEDNSSKTGTLHFSCTMPNANASKKIMPMDSYVCTITDIISTVEEIAVSTEAIIDGEEDDIQWSTILTNDEEKRFTLQSVNVELEPGNYQSIKIVQKNSVKWVCDYEGTEYEFQDYNCSTCDPDGYGPVNYFYTDGLHYVDDNNEFYTQTNKEKIGGFEIIEGKTTNVTWVININTLEWFDNNDNGVWDTGIDSLNNWTAMPGKETMFDFIVEYE